MSSLRGDSWRGPPPSPRCEASRAASDLVQVSRRPKSKHGRSPAACESNGDGFEMENADNVVASMAESRSVALALFVAERQ